MWLTVPVGSYVEAVERFSIEVLRTSDYCNFKIYRTNYIYTRIPSIITVMLDDGGDIRLCTLSLPLENKWLFALLVDAIY